MTEELDKALAHGRGWEGALKRVTRKYWNRFDYLLDDYDEDDDAEDEEEAGDDEAEEDEDEEGESDCAA